MEIVSPSQNIILGNPESNVAVATLWTKHQDVASQLNPEDYAVVGQLYEKFGISYMLRNLAANPKIRHLIVCGADLSGSGEATVRLWQDGLDDNHQVKGVDKSPIQVEIPTEAVDLLRQNINLVDLRGVKNSEIAARLTRQIAGLPILPAWGEPLIFADPQIIVANRLPAEPGAHLVVGKTIGQTWLKMLQEIMRFGEDAGTNYGNRARDLNNLVAVVTDEDPRNPQVEDYFNFTKSDLPAYVAEFLNPNLPEDVFYTYGERFRRYGDLGIDQSQIIIDKLKKDPNDRGAVAILYDVIKDNQIDRDEKIVNGFRTSCILSYQGYIRDNAFELVANFRSNDMYGAWPRNAFGLRFMQQWMARQLDRPMGPLVTFSTRAHIYEDVWPQISSILANYKGSFEEDPRGNLRINTENDQIRITHQDSSGAPLRPDFILAGNRNKAAWAAGFHLIESGVFSSPQHSLDIGIELAKAELAIKLGLPYRQDSNEIFNQILEMAEKARKYDALNES